MFLFSPLAVLSSPQSSETVGHFKSVENESYGVLGGGVPQSIELKDNAAYSVVAPLAATSTQPIAVNSNVAYKITATTTEAIYDEATYY